MDKLAESRTRRGGAPAIRHRMATQFSRTLHAGWFLAAIPELQPRPITGSPFVHHSNA